MEPFFSPNSNRHLRSDTHQSQFIGGDADVDDTQTIGGIKSNYWGDISPRVSAPLTAGLPIKIIKIYNIRDPDVVFVIEDLCNGWVKKDGVNANVVSCNWRNYIRIDFAFSPRLSILLHQAIKSDCLF